MRVSGLTPDGDWRFGRGRASYLSGSDAIAQSVQTRLKSFVNDWLFDTSANIDWVRLMGTRGVTAAQIRSEVLPVVLATDGVAAVDELTPVIDRANRTVTIMLTYTDIYGIQTQTEVAP